jgi:ABC-type branched-subunit amino acid transport system ATPase component/ABC-type branched-subunit amino acid transport system permease subunit
MTATSMSAWRRVASARGPLLATAVTAAIAFAAAPVLPPYLLTVLILGTIYSIFALGLNILMGFTGLDSLGQAAFFGASGYALGLLTTRYGWTWALASLAGVVVALVLAMVFGLLAVRLQGLYFLLITLALGQVLWGAVLRLGSFTGGWNGLRGIVTPAMFSKDPVAFFNVSLAVLVVVFLATKVLIASPFGLSLLGIRERELRSTTLGFNTFRHKYVAYVLAGFIAGLAGILSATYNSFVSPRDLSLTMSFDVMLMVILGGTGTVVGPIVGALIVTAMRLLLSVWITDTWRIVLGLVYIAATLWLPRGIMGLAVFSAGRGRGAVLDGADGGESAGESPIGAELGGSVAAPASSEGSWGVGRVATDGPVLQLAGIGKQFGGVTVLEGIDVDVRAGERIGIIGLNGAGKTTLFQVVTGIYGASSGTVHIDGRDVTALPPDRRNAAGLARTFQITALYPRLTVAENLTLALLGRRFSRLKFVLWRRAGAFSALQQAVDDLLGRIGLSHLRDVEVRFLSYGHQRQIEVGLAMASEPSILLLDEPTAGLSQAEVPAMLHLLKALPSELTILIVEHNLEVIFEIVQRVLVLHEGRLILDGRPEEIRTNERVRNLYLGTAAEVPDASGPNPTHA